MEEATALLSIGSIPCVTSAHNSSFTETVHTGSVGAGDVVGAGVRGSVVGAKEIDGSRLTVGTGVGSSLRRDGSKP